MTSCPAGRHMIPKTESAKTAPQEHREKRGCESRLYKEPLGGLDGARTRHRLEIQFNMESSQESPQPSPQPANSTNPTILNVDMQWRKWRSQVTDANNPDAGPLYITEFKTWGHPQMIYKRGSDNQTIGSGTLHAFNIDADYELHGRKDTLVAQKRFHTIYTHRSLAMSDTKNPVTLTWTSDCGFKTWDFVCVDEQQMPVARFVTNVWATKKIGRIEFMGPRADSEALRDEIVVVGLTLVYCMALRSASILSFFGAFFASPGHDRQWKGEDETAADAGKHS